MSILILHGIDSFQKRYSELPAARNLSCFRVHPLPHSHPDVRQLAEEGLDVETARWDVSSTMAGDGDPAY